MNKFVCEECGCIDSLDYLTEGLDLSKESVHPHFTMQDMVNQDIQICNRCNTGSWHGKFEELQATPEQIEVANYSKLNYINQVDHEEGCLDKLDDGTYVVNPDYAKLHKAFRQEYQVTKDTHILELDNEFMVLYIIFIDANREVNQNISIDDFKEGNVENFLTEYLDVSGNDNAS